MTQVYLFSLVSQNNAWLSARQATVASNVVNANTPGFKAQDLAPFESALNDARVSMSASHSNHLTIADLPTRDNTQVQSQDGWEVTHSGNSVNLEQELVKAGEINRSYRLNANVVKTFHRLMLASTKV